jgi:hypothetical protein
MGQPGNNSYIMTRTLPMRFLETCCLYKINMIVTVLRRLSENYCQDFVGFYLLHVLQAPGRLCPGISSEWWKDLLSFLMDKMGFNEPVIR